MSKPEYPLTHPVLKTAPNALGDFVVASQRYNIDILRDADKMFLVFAKNIGSWEPPYSLHITDTAYNVIFDLPAYPSDALKTSVTRYKITVSGSQPGNRWVCHWKVPTDVALDGIYALALDNQVVVVMPRINTDYNVFNSLL